MLRSMLHSDTIIMYTNRATNNSKTLVSLATILKKDHKSSSIPLFASKLINNLYFMKSMALQVTT